MRTLKIWNLEPGDDSFVLVLQGTKALVVQDMPFVFDELRLSIDAYEHMKFDDDTGEYVVKLSNGPGGPHREG